MCEAVEFVLASPLCVKRSMHVDVHNVCIHILACVSCACVCRLITSLRFHVIGSDVVLSNCVFAGTFAHPTSRDFVSHLVPCIVIVFIF